MNPFIEEDEEEDVETTQSVVPPQDEEYTFQLASEEFTPYEEPTPAPADDIFQVEGSNLTPYEEETQPDYSPDYRLEKEAFIPYLDEVDQTQIVPPMEAGKDYLVADDIRNSPERMQIIRDYMIMRNGAQYKPGIAGRVSNMSAGDMAVGAVKALASPVAALGAAIDINDTDMYDDFINTMRYVNSNELTLSYDMGLLTTGTPEDKAKMAKAYELYGQLGNFYQTDGFIGGLDAIKDYAWSVATSPTTYLGLGMGKLFSSTAMQGGKKAAINAVIRSAKEAAIKEFVGKKVAQSVIAQRTADLAAEGVKGVTKSMVGKEIAIMAAAEGTVNTVFDIVQQDHMMNVGVQDEYSFLQTGIAAGLGVALTAVPGTLGYKTAVKGRTAETIQLDAAIGSAKRNEARMAGRINYDGVTTGLKRLRGKLVDWDEAVRKGEALDLGEFSRSQQVIVSVFGTQKGELGLIPTMMRDANIVLDPDERVVQQMLTFVEELPLQDRADLDQLFADSLGEGLTLSTVSDSLAATVSQMGSTFQAINESGKQLSKDAVRKKLAREAIEGAEEVVEAPISKVNEVMRFSQSAWKRALVSHPATTAVNVMGWAQASGARQLALMTSGAYYGATGWAAKLASPFSASAKTLADANLQKAQRIMQSYSYTLNTLFHPSATMEEFNAIMKGWDHEMTVRTGPKAGTTRTVKETAIPEKYTKQLDRAAYSSGGQAVTTGKGAVAKGVEKYLDVAQTLSMVKLQDSWTKSVSFMSSLNTALIRSTGKGYEETVRTVGFKGIPDEAWDQATRAALRDVMSTDYTKGKGMMSSFAKSVENISNNTLMGWFLPFGRFMNNALAFTYQYSPLGLARGLGKHPHETWEDIISQSAVGSAALYFAFAREEKKAEQGIPWYVEEGTDGTQYDFNNLAPGSAYSLMGRIMHHIVNEGENPVDETVLKDLVMQLGSASILTTFDKANEGVTDKLIKMFDSLAGEDVDGKGVTSGILSGIAQAGAGIFAGFTRPLEPISSMFARNTDTDYLVNRSGLDGFEAASSEATRYIDGFFAPFIEEGKKPVRYDAINPRGHREANPIARWVGMRTVQPQTEVERMFAEAFYPEWKGNQKSNIPALDAVINERIFTVLEQRAIKLRNTDQWRSAGLSTKRKLVGEILTKTRSEVLQWATNSSDTNVELFKLQDTYSRVPEDLRKRAQDAFGIHKPIKEMSWRDIKELTDYTDYLRRGDKELVK